MTRRAPLLAGLAALLPAGCAGAPPAAKPPPPPRPVVLLTDFGLRDDAVGLMRGVILSRAPRAEITDLTHRVPRFDVRAGSRLLAEAPGLYPPGSVFVVVVDPGVGTKRRAIVALLKNGALIVAPDNGVITEAAARHGVSAVREVTNPALVREQMSTTFHGRDVFAPVGGHLAAGVPFREVGPEVTDWIRLEPLPRTKGPDGLRGVVVAIDEPFGNVWTNLPGGWPAALGAKPGDLLTVTFARGSRRIGPLCIPLARTFGDVPRGEPLVYVNSRGAVALALNRADFARRHGIRGGETVRISK